MKRLIVITYAIFVCAIFALSGCASNPSFVGKALPGIIESNEKKLAKDPSNKALILDTGRYIISYANAFVEGEANMLPPEDFALKQSEKQRARDLYARGIAVLETAEDVDDDPDFLYWKAAGTLAAFASDPFDYSSGLGSQVQSRIQGLLYANEISPDYGGGSIDELLFMIYASLPAEIGGDKEKALVFYQSALEKTRALRPGIFVTYAESISVPAQNRAEFQGMLERAIAINPSTDKINALANKVSQKRARWLLANIENFFIGE